MENTISGVDTATKITYYNEISADGVVKESKPMTSDLFTYYFKSAAAGCKVNKDINSCQQLANLCVLQMYDSSTAACKFFQTLRDDPNRQ